MKVKLEHKGYCGTGAYNNMLLYAPHGYHRYLLIAANGIIVYVAQPVENGLVPDGEYDMPDAVFSYDNPLWDKMAELDIDTVWDLGD